MSAIAPYDRGVTQPTPTPPPGPGAQPPFVAAPTEGSSARLWWGLGTGALALLLCGGGGLAVFIAMIVTGVRAVQEQTDQTVTRYVQALERGRFDDAYDLVCDSLRKRYTIEEFQDLERDTITSTGFQVGDLNLNDLTVPVRLEYSTGSSQSVVYQLSQDTKTGHFEVCGTA
jgi:hypothetical protein